MVAKYEYILIKNPWKRFFARMVDYFIYGIIVSFLWLLFLWEKFNEINPFIITFSFPFIEFILLFFFWNTIWKVVLGLKIINLENPKEWLTFKQSFFRSFILYFINFPIIFIITGLFYYWQVRKYGQTSYDDKLKLNVYSKWKEIKEIEWKKINLSNIESKKDLNIILNETILKTKNNIHLKKEVDLSKAVFEIMNVWEILHINEIIKRIINWLYNNSFYIKLNKDNVDRIAVIESYLVWENQPSQSKVAECFKKLWNWNFKMIKNPYFIQEKTEIIEDKNQEKKIKEPKNPWKNFIEILFFSWFFRPKFVNLENLTNYSKGRLFIVSYMFSFLIWFLSLPLVEKCLSSSLSTWYSRRLRRDVSHYICDEYWYRVVFDKFSYFEEFLIQIIIFYIFMTIILSIFYKLYIYVKKW